MEVAGKHEKVDISMEEIDFTDDEDSRLGIEGRASNTLLQEIQDKQE
jgi:hypothetical protein